MTPIPEMDALGKESQDPQRKAALTSCIAEQVRAGRTKEEATAICHQMVEDKAGG